MLFARLSPKWMPRRTASNISLVPADEIPPAIDPPPADHKAFIPKDADWWFDRSALSPSHISSWNKAAASNSLGAATTVDLAAAGMPGKLSLQPNAVQPRCVASGKHVGALRAMRRTHSPFNDPTGGPNDTRDHETMHSAHNWARLAKSDGSLWTIPYGQQFEIGFKFLVPASSDSDLAAFSQPDCQWTFICAPSTSSGPTTSVYRILLNFYGHKQAVLLNSGYVNSSKTETDTFYGPGGVRGRGYEIQPSWTRPWLPNVWYAIRLIGVVDQRSDAKGWVKLFIDDMTTPFIFATGIRNGKHNETATKAVEVGQYSDWGLKNRRRCIYFDQCYLKMGAGGYPPPK